MSYDDFRAYLKKEDANPEIDGFYYELSSHELIHGIWNCEVLTLGFVRGEFYSNLRFRPKDTDKPVIFAIDGVSSKGCHFIVVDAHLDDGFDKMRNYDPFKTDDFLIDCTDDAGIGRKHSHWSVKKDGITFVYTKRDHPGFPDTWTLTDCDLLCALVGGGITANELRAKAYKAEKEEKKERRRKEYIRDLKWVVQEMSEDSTARKKRIRQLEKDLSKYEVLNEKFSSLLKELGSHMSGFWPWINKKSVKKILDFYKVK